MVAKQQTHFDKAAPAGQIHTPVFFSIVLIFDLNIADALKEQLKQEVLVLAHETMNLAALLSSL